MTFNNNKRLTSMKLLISERCRRVVRTGRGRSRGTSEPKGVTDLTRALRQHPRGRRVGTPPAMGSLPPSVHCRPHYTISVGVCVSQSALSTQRAMAPTGSLFITGKRCLKVLRSFTNLKRRIAAAVLQDKPNNKSAEVSQQPKCLFHLSITSLDKDRHNDSRSVDTVMTWLDESSTPSAQEISDNRLNERLEVQRAPSHRLK